MGGGNVLSVGFRHNSEAFDMLRLFSNYFFTAVSILRTAIEAEAPTPAIPIKDAAAKVIKFFIPGNPFA